MAEPKHTDQARKVGQEPRRFSGGEIVFFADRVELCGVDICSGSRSKTRRRILELLAEKKQDGRFVAYSLKKLTGLVKPKSGQSTAVSGQIRDIRGDITSKLREEANILCGRTEVILSGGPGYRPADCLTVRCGDLTGQSNIKDIGRPADVANEDIGDVPDVRNDDVRDVPNASGHNQASARRRAWILQRLQAGDRLRAGDLAKEFECSLKTAQRDLAALKGENKIYFDGAARTGWYRLRRLPGGSR